jgi:glycosyltransferase involved in cell wall biosynthesis
MIIGVDGNEANVEKRVGVSTYTLNLLECFQKNANKDLEFRVYLRNPPMADLPQENKHFQYRKVTGKFLWSQLFLPLELNLKREIDVFFTPAHYAPRFCPVPLIVTIHDLSYFYYRDEFLKEDLYKLKNWTKYSLDKAVKVIAVSKTTKKDIMKFYSVPDEKIEVIYNGYEKRTQNNNIKIKIEKPYLLYVGTLQPRKNITTLIKAYSLLKKDSPEFKLVIVGRKGWLYEEIFELVKELRLENEVIFAGYVPDEELAGYYKNAFSFVMPSLYEGFGIPVLEAMSYGCPVISSFSSSLPEIGGEAALYFDPKNEKNLLEKIKELKENSSLRNELVKKGKERVKLFSWCTAAEKTLSVIKNSANK